MRIQLNAPRSSGRSTPWSYICPKCLGLVNSDSYKCVHCGEEYFGPIKIPSPILKNPSRIADYVHKVIFPTLTPEQLEYLTQYFTTYFEEDWENNDFDLWTGTVGTPVIQGTYVHDGIYALKCDTNRYGCYYIANMGTTTYYRFYFMCRTLPEWDKVTIAEMWDTPNYNQYVFILLNPSGVIYLNILGTEYSSGTTLSTDTWYCIEVQRTTGSGSGIVKLWINDAIKIDRTAETISDSTDEVDIGLTDYDGDDCECYFDGIKVADARIYSDNPPSAVSQGILVQII